jgi:hypothetical protein
MRFSVVAIALNLALVVVIPGAVLADDSHVRWEDVIGIIQAGNLVGTGTGRVTGGGQPWSTTGGSASVNLGNGDLHFRVQGLVLAGGNAIGTRDAITNVKGTLVCDTDGSAGGGNSTLVESAAVPLSVQGDADFNGSLGPLPAACLNEPDIAFLILIAGGAADGRWIANGAVRRP